MFLNRRDIIAWVLLFLASLCWVFGIALANDPGELDVLTGTEPAETIETSTFPWVSATSDSSSVTEYDATTETTVTAVTDVNGEIVESDEDVFVVSESYQRLKRVAGVLLCVGTSCMGAVSVFVLRQKKTLIGPDGVCLVLGSLFVLSETVAVDYSLLLLPSVRFALAALNTVTVFSVLFSLRELFCWVMSGFSGDNCLIFRIAKKCRRPQFALVFFVLWILLAFSGGLTAIYIGTDGDRLPIMPFMLFCVMFALGAICVWKYGADLNHFKKQLANYQNGLPITVGKGVFSQTEAQLLDVQAKHEEAIRSAVISERFKVELISNVSHDLRTPLTSILGYGELLQKEELSSEGREQLRLLNVKAEYMNELVESIFELTKVSSGVLAPKNEEIDLVRLLEQTVGFYDDRLSEYGLVVRRSYEKDSLPVVTDGARMHRVFANLIGNAIKYSLNGTRIYIDVSSVGDKYRVRMLNTASYEMDFASDEIVKRFVRGDKARTTKGSGLGLAIAKTYTESVGGEFYVTVDGDQFCAVAELPKNLRDL